MTNRKIIRRIAECGILMALALALSFVKIFSFPHGGSISLDSLPLLLIAARYGFKTGFICGFCFGILKLGNGATFLKLLQYLFDYPLAFACLGIAGLIKWDTPLKAITATTLANLVRLHIHVIAGILFFFEKETNFNVTMISSSYIYNCGYLIPETIICAVIVWFIALKHRNLCSQQF